MLDWLIEPDRYNYQCDDCEHESNNKNDFEMLDSGILLCNKCYNTKCENCGARGSEANSCTTETEHYESKVCPTCYIKQK